MGSEYYSEDGLLNAPAKTIEVGSLGKALDTRGDGGTIDMLVGFAQIGTETVSPIREGVGGNGAHNTLEIVKGHLSTINASSKVDREQYY